LARPQLTCQSPVRPEACRVGLRDKIETRRESGHDQDPSLHRRRAPLARHLRSRTPRPENHGRVQSSSFHHATVPDASTPAAVGTLLYEGRSART